FLLSVPASRRCSLHSSSRQTVEGTSRVQCADISSHDRPTTRLHISQHIHCVRRERILGLIGQYGVTPQIARWRLRCITQDMTDVMSYEALVQRHFRSTLPYWEQIYADRTVYSRIYQERARRALACIDRAGLSAEGLVLEIGCGPGV